MTKTLSRNDYYLALAYWIIACQKEAEVFKHAQLLTELIEDSLPVDSIYNPETKPDKDEFDKLLLKAGILVDWNQKSISSEKVTP